MDPESTPGATPNTEIRIIKMVLDWQERQSEIARRDLRWRNIRGILLAISILLAPFLSVLALQPLANVPSLANGYAALVRIDGIIEAGSRASAEHINTSLEHAFNDKKAKGIIIAIDSPGGTPVQANLINDRIRALRAEHPAVKVWAVGEDMLTSGAYLAAVAAPNICVNESTITGSIGVRMDSFGFPGVLKSLNIERRSFHAGEHKERLDAYQPLTDEDRLKANQLLHTLHEQFIQAVKTGRGTRLNGNQEDLFSGDFWTGNQAVQLGLVDRLCSLNTILKTEYGVSAVRDYSPPPGLLSALTGNVMKTASDVAISAFNQAQRPVFEP